MRPCGLFYVHSGAGRSRENKTYVRGVQLLRIVQVLLLARTSLRYGCLYRKVHSVTFWPSHGKYVCTTWPWLESERAAVKALLLAAASQITSALQDQQPSEFVREDLGYPHRR